MIVLTILAFIAYNLFLNKDRSSGYGIDLMPAFRFLSSAIIGLVLVIFWLCTL